MSISGFVFLGGVGVGRGSMAASAVVCSIWCPVGELAHCRFCCYLVCVFCSFSSVFTFVAVLPLLIPALSSVFWHSSPCFSLLAPRWHTRRRQLFALSLRKPYQVVSGGTLILTYRRALTYMGHSDLTDLRHLMWNTTKRMPVASKMCSIQVQPL